MAARTIGSIQPFDENTETFTCYIERLELFFIANDVKDDKKLASLLSLIGPKTYTLLRGLTSPQKPKEKTYDEVVKLLENHLSPVPLEIAERYKFHQRCQEPNENVSSFLAELRKLTEHCNYGEFLTQAIRDRFVCGLANESIQKRLLCERDLKLEKAVNMAIAMEKANKDANAFHHQAPEPSPKSNPTHQQVFKVENTKKCMSCGKTGHARKECPFYDATCRLCKKRGHISTICMSSRFQQKNNSSSPQETHSLGEQMPEGGEENDIPCLHIYKCGNTNPPIMVGVEIEGTPISMELDTGSSVSIIPSMIYEKACKHLEMRSTNIKLRTYDNGLITPKGVVNANVSYNGKCQEAQMYVVDGPSVALFGRSWLNIFKLDWPSIKSIHVKNAPLDALLEKYRSDVFGDKLGCLKGYSAQLHVLEGAPPVHHKHRTVAFSVRPKIEAELDELERQGIISPISNSEWATPVVPVVKKSGSVRLCGDYKITVNPQLVTDTYPLPTLDDLQEKMNGGSIFSKLDLAKAYSQIPIHESSRQYTTLTTHKGMYAYNRLPFGISSSAAIFQRQMDRIFKDLPHVLCYQDDILVTGKDHDQHIATLEEVLRRLQENGLTVRRDKCEFMKTSLQYLGHTIDKDGIHPVNDKVEAIKSAPPPEGVSQLRAFLGLVNYYQKFMPNLSHVLHPLHQLLQKENPWMWNQECQKAFDKVKSMITVDHVLVPYNADMPVILDCDASAYGLGAVLSHRMADGSEHPIAFASRTLSKSERNYAQIDKEALSIVFGITRFHVYLYGRHFTLRTDHQPLLAILGPKRGIPPIAAMRMQRWATKLSAYSYDIVYRASKEHSNADGLSRLPRARGEPAEDIDVADVYQLEQLDPLPLTAEDIRQQTLSDPLLRDVYNFVSHGFPRRVEDNFKPYLACAPELTLLDGCIMRGQRVVVPTALRGQVLRELHEGHLGIVRMKEIARNHVWWPGVDKDIECLAKSCEPCNVTRNAPSLQYHPWIYPQAPWERVPIDFAGPIRNMYFLIVTDAYSKWMEITPMHTITTAATINVLRDHFSRFGLPIHLVSDNGPQLTSAEFAEFIQRNGIRHTTTAPYHPNSNGQAERSVETFKLAYEAGRGPPSQRIANFLLQYRNTSHGTTHQSPAKLMFGRSLRTRIDLLLPFKGRSHRPTPSVFQPSRTFQEGQLVWYRDFTSSTDKWAKGQVVSRHGSTMYDIQPQSHPDQTIRRHLDQLTSRTEAPEFAKSTGGPPPTQCPIDDPTQEDDRAVQVPENYLPPSTSGSEARTPAQRVPPHSNQQQEAPEATPDIPQPSMLRRSERTTKGIPPERLSL